MMQTQDFNRASLLRGLGVAPSDAMLSRTMGEMITTLCKVACPRTIWRIYPINRDRGLCLGDVPLLGRDIALHLTGCTEAAVLAVTLSSSVDTIIRRFQATDMTKALFLDAIAAEACEHLCHDVEKQVRARTAKVYMTARFSAGYGDFPLSTQAGLLRLLDAQRKIGLTVTQNQLLLPMKSVTAIIGLSNTPVQDARKYVCGVNCIGCPRYDTCRSRISR
ncbi:MAG: 5-methyltetrahydrofolate--homocysteine methyltransferase [Oscillospiraceae bacterium]|nr:5-methyltetrahydrofolate--homocysteine methyltransferase [Oscillospiraceae bacterium]